MCTIYSNTVAIESTPLRNEQEMSSLDISGVYIPFGETKALPILHVFVLVVQRCTLETVLRLLLKFYSRAF